MATMNDVARLASVSIATVSHVINGTRFVSAERVERVHAAMQELGYTPDATARSLRVGRTHTIGLVIPDTSNPFFAALARWIEEAGFESGYTTILANSDDTPTASAAT
jgi:LacI family transcriptional regulator